MSEITTTRCYIEPYTVGGKTNLRLREKLTGRKVVLGTTTQDGLDRFLEFIRSAASHPALPDLLEKDRDGDAIEVRGHVDIDTPAELRFKYDQQLSHLIV